MHANIHVCACTNACIRVGGVVGGGGRGGGGLRAMDSLHIYIYEQGVHACTYMRLCARQ